jgi:histone deacetylase 11
MQISPDGIALRDEKVFRFAREKNIPIVMLTSGLHFSLSLSYIGHVHREIT